MSADLSPEALAAIDKVGKLLKLARDKRGNEHEAQNALDMAHRILEAHNLDMAFVERQAGQGHAKRDDKSSGGGLYKWQRAVWGETAKLNMCVYFSIKGLDRGARYENRLVGKPENVLMTTLMAEYLVDTIERIAADWAKERGYSSRFVREAIIYREGMADTVGRRLRDMHAERVAEAKRQKAAAPASSGTALIVLSDLIQDEADLNTDYLHGLEPGTTKARREKQAVVNAEYAAKAKIDRDKRLHWKTNPSDFEVVYGAAEAAKQRAEGKREADYVLYCAGKKSDTYGAGYKPSRSRGGGGSYRYTEADRRRDSYEYQAGARRGEDISLDRQVNKQSNTRIG